MGLKNKRFYSAQSEILSSKKKLLISFYEKLYFSTTNHTSGLHFQPLKVSTTQRKQSQMESSHQEYCVSIVKMLIFVGFLLSVVGSAACLLDVIICIYCAASNVKITVCKDKIFYKIIFRY